MFKIFYGVLLSVLILVVSIACSSAPPEEYVTQVEYNKLLTHTSELEISLAELETRLSTLQLLVLTDIVRLDYEDDENAKSITKARGAFAWFGTNYNTTVGKQCKKFITQDGYSNPSKSEACMLKIHQHLSKDIK